MAKSVLACLLVSWLLGPAPAAPQTPSVLAELAWLAGTWRAEEVDGSFHEETWCAPRGDAICGMYREAGPEGRVQLYELLAIELDSPALPQAAGDGPLIPGQERGGAPQRLVYRMRHFDRGLAPWKSEAAGPLTMQVARIGEDELLLEAPDREFPRTLRYRREGDRMKVELRSASPGGRSFDFELRRAGG